MITPADMIAAEPLPGWRGRFFHSGAMTFAHYDVAADAVAIHEHHHPQEEVWNVTAGTIELTVASTTHTLNAGDAAVVPPDTPHRARALSAAKAIVVDHPVRRQLPGSAH